MNEITVVRTDEDKPEGAYIRLGEYRLWNFNHSQQYGIRLWAYPRTGGVKEFFVSADTQHEPETKNMMGTKGAYRDIEPAGQKIQEKIEAAKRFIQGCDNSDFIVDGLNGKVTSSTLSGAKLLADQEYASRKDYAPEWETRIYRQFDGFIVDVVGGLPV